MHTEKTKLISLEITLCIIKSNDSGKSIKHMNKRGGKRHEKSGQQLKSLSRFSILPLISLN